jgi:fumigallin biosynthesis monooxygenase-like protein
MATTIPKRMTAAMDGDFVVFLIGMRVNRWWKVWRWLRVALAMPRMIRELGQHPELGFLGAEQWFGRTTILLSYWRSTEHLMEYAKSRSAAHLPAWRAFNRLIGTNGDVGIWHETYRVRPGDFETVYVNMPAFGAGKVGALVEASGRRERAAGRLAAATEPVKNGTMPA